MDRDGMEMNIKVGEQWVSLEAYRRLQRFEHSIECIGTIAIVAGMIVLALLSL